MDSPSVATSPSTFRGRRNFRHHRRFFVTLGLVAMTAVPAFADSPSKVGNGSVEWRSVSAQRDKITQAGLSFLEEKGQSDTGTFSDRVGPGITALAITSALRNGRPIDDPMVASGLKALESFVQKDGGIYGSGRLKNYETCVAMVCFAQANADGRYDQILQDAKRFVTDLHYGNERKDPSDPSFGGASYSGDERPDLSNTGYLIEALRSVETPTGDPAIQAALKFISRCQNLDSPHNDTAYADKVDDGGFYYVIPDATPESGTPQGRSGRSDERTTANGGLRSYGSMTYTGLKSMIYAGLQKNDPRVKAAVRWIEMNYGVDRNPGMGSAGLFYYYHTFAAALNATGLQVVTDADGHTHHWKADLIAELAERQNDDGSWSNENGQWFENDKNLATAFALMALSYCDVPGED
ncbi:prenyltransferase/squalene oxidase repeat-containing protein [Crateriforma spongiae]|uniref:prenyltransferase/squalene oxidase repeat-containing protein n=1 Tax=Crateriforma spongiae TaxID=2724528 RepID=UPI0014486512|nr:prenyltransferase/squalene oxidase repeat-containing protein [Crateriforma spongiae]